MKIRLTNRLAFPFGLIGSIILIYICFAFRSRQTDLPSETYLIPRNFEGRFRIIYGETCGIEPKIENGARVLEIPNSRLLVIKPRFKEGITNKEFFFVDKKGRRTKIVELDNYDQRRTIRPGIILNMMNGTSAVMAGAMPDGSSSSESPLAIRFTEFIVFNKDTTMLDPISQLRADMKFDPMMSTLVEDCRKKNGR